MENGQEKETKRITMFVNQISSLNNPNQLLKQKKGMRWITLLVFFIVFPIWLGTVYWAFQKQEIIYPAVSLLTILSYILFTVVHEASHGNITSNKSINYLLGLFSSLSLGPLTSYSGYQYLHLRHHRYTNDSKLDPDICSGKRVIFPLFIQWLITDLFYLYHYLTIMKNVPLAKNILVNVELFILLGLVGISIYLGFFDKVFWYWILPSRITIFLLAFLFNYIPHWPYRDPSSAGPLTRNIEKWPMLLTPVFMCHNYHAIHHQNPGLPFYLYRTVYLSTKNISVKEASGEPIAT